MPCMKKSNPLGLNEALWDRFIPVPSPEDAARIQTERLSRFSKELTVILELELSAGNIVVETNEGWPDTKSIFVMLSTPFRARQSSLPSGVTYRDVDDPHYWKAEYVDQVSSHILACRF